MKAFLCKLVAVVVTFSLVCPQIAYSNLNPADMTFGNASIACSGSTCTITTTADKAWSQSPNFSNKAGETIQINQPNSWSAFLAKANNAQIFGNLFSNGQVFIVAPNIIIGANSSIDVAGLVASTLDISVDDFMAAGNNYVFSGNTGRIVNFGTITSKTGGYVALLSPHINNSGVVLSPLGTVALASGEKITLGLDAGNLISVAINEAITQNLTNANSAIENHGVLKADGGQVILTAKTLNTVFNNAINNQGIIEANALSDQDGTISLLANNNILVAGRIEAEGDITIDSTDGDVVHRLSFVEGELKGIVSTKSGAFYGNAGNDYVMKNGTVIDVPSENFDISYGNDFILGSATEDVITVFDWEYLTEERGYKLREFGYYTNDDGVITFHPLIIDDDIRKGDSLLPILGSGSFYGDEEMQLYAVFIDYEGKALRYFTEDHRNAGGENHVAIFGNSYVWEDTTAPSLIDYNDAEFNFGRTIHRVSTPPVPPKPKPPVVQSLSTAFYRDEFPVYYEILWPSQFLSFEPATAIGLYAYHPLTPVDQTAFDDIRLDFDAYEFIDDNIRRRREFDPYFNE